MATEIASLYASIGANTSELQKALSQASRLLGDASRQFETAGRASDQFDRHTKSTGLNLGSLKTQFIASTAGVVAFGAAMKKVYDTAREGATIEQTRQSFDRLGVSLDSLRDASRGTIDDMGLMSGALTLVAGASGELQSKLLGAAPQLLEIAKAANALNPTLGDTAFMYQSIATGIKRSSPLILDNLGIIVKVGEANERYAATLGKTVEAMTAEEKQIALLNATIEAGGRLIEQAGGSAASAGDAFAQLGTYTKNAAADFKVFVYEAVEPAVRWLADLLNKAQELMRMQREAGAGALADPDISWEIYARNQMSAAQEAGEFARMVESNVVGALRAQGYNTTEIIGLTKDYNTTVQTAIRLGLGWGEVMSRQEFEFRRMAKSSMDVGVGMTAFPRTYEQAAKAADNYRSSLFALGATSKTVGSAYENEIQRLGQLAQERRAAMAEAEAQAKLEKRVADLNVWSSVTLGRDLAERSDNIEELRAKQAALRAEIDKLTAANGRAVTTTRAASLTENERALVAAQLIDAQARLNEQLSKAPDDQNAVSIARLRVQMDGYNEKLGEASTSTTTFIDNTKKIGELEGEFAGLQGEIDGIAEAMQRMAAQTVASFMSTLISVDGKITEQEAAMYSHYMYGAGLIDATTRDMMLGTQELVQSVNDETRTGVEAAAGLLLATEGVVQEFINAGEVGTTKFGEILTAAGFTADQIDRIQQEAIAAQIAIDAMHGKELEIIITQRLKIAGEAYTPEVFGPELWSGGPAFGGMQAAGGDYMVTRPTMFIAGEAGPERATFTPMGGGRGGGGGDSYTYYITGYDPREIADEIERRQRARGIDVGSVYR